MSENLKSDDFELQQFFLVISYMYWVGIRAEEFFKEFVEGFVNRGIDEEDLYWTGVSESVKFLYAFCFLAKDSIENNIFKSIIVNFINDNKSDMTTM